MSYRFIKARPAIPSCCLVLHLLCADMRTAELAHHPLNRR